MKPKINSEFASMFSFFLNLSKVSFVDSCGFVNYRFN
jgi:hypothetical protein